MKRVMIAVAMTVSVAMPVQASTITDFFSSFYVFGDSLSDDGKFGQLDPPSLDGRFSSGPTAAEYIKDMFESAGHDAGNLALGGATAGDFNPRSVGPLSTFTGQIATFANALATSTPLPTRLLPSLEFADASPDPGTNPLVSVFFGANDIFVGTSPIVAANAVADGIRALGTIAGGLFNDILLTTLPDLGKTPLFNGDEATGTALTAAFNGQLFANISDLRAEGFNIILFDVNEVIDTIFESVENKTFEFGIFDTETPCTVSIGAPLDPNFENPGSCLDIPGFDPETLFFVDGVHPNGTVHRLSADAISGELTDYVTAIPLPASLPMLLAGLGGIALIARRRKAA